MHGGTLQKYLLLVLQSCTATLAAKKLNPVASEIIYELRSCLKPALTRHGKATVETCHIRLDEAWTRTLNTKRICNLGAPSSAVLKCITRTASGCLTTHTAHGANNSNIEVLRCWPGWYALVLQHMVSVAVKVCLAKGRQYLEEVFV